jgi:nucleotide-binding universal stress UspA family protein
MSTERLNFKTIVVATDLSDTSSSALRYAQAIARNHESTLVVVYVVDPVGYAFPQGSSIQQGKDQAAKEELRDIEEQTIRQGIPVHSIVETGVIFERILQATHDHHADLLVLGTKARTEAGRVALGTVARQLLAKAPCPILTVSPDAEAHMPTAGVWRTVLVATDFSEASLSALKCAHRMANEQLIAVHGSEHDDASEWSHQLDRLRFLAPFNESHGVPVEHIVTSGDAARQIVECAGRTNADIVVLGSPAVELSPEEFPSSTVVRVISGVGCPVLCVPADGIFSEAEAADGRMAHGRG